MAVETAIVFDSMTNPEEEELQAPLAGTADPAEETVLPSEPAPPPQDLDLKAEWQAWKADADPTRLGRMLNRLTPTIQSSLASQNSTDNPAMVMQAKVIALDALKTYDPNSGAGIPTWVSQQMQRLGRIRRENMGPVKIPDRAWLDHYAIQKATATFFDKKGREPNEIELSDLTGMPIKRLKTVRQTVRKVASEGAFGEGAALQVDQPDFQLDEALEAVYRESDPVDKKILEMRANFGGKYDQPLGLSEIAVAVKKDPASVHRRAQRLALKIQQTKSLLEEVYGRP